jgi:hypothetical protein
MTLIRSREVWETHMDPHPDQLLRDRAGGPIPDDVETMARDVMWYAYALGDDQQMGVEPPRVDQVEQPTAGRVGDGGRVDGGQRDGTVPGNEEGIAFGQFEQ